MPIPAAHILGAKAAGVAAAAAAGNKCRIAGIVDGSKGSIVAGNAVGKLVHIGFPQQNGSGEKTISQPLPRQPVGDGREALGFWRS